MIIYFFNRLFSIMDTVITCTTNKRTRDDVLEDDVWFDYDIEFEQSLDQNRLNNSLFTTNYSKMRTRK
jgi:hypothetical protein